MQPTLNSFVIRQYQQISAQGWPSLKRKIKKLVLLPIQLPSIFIAFILVVLIRLLRPFVIFRIGMMDLGRIGGIYQGDWYLAEKADGKHQGRYLDFFYFSKSTNHVNRQWKKMWRNTVPYVPGCAFWVNMQRLNRLIPGYNDHEIPNNHIYPDLVTWNKHLRNPNDGKIKVFNDRLKSILKNVKSNISFNTEEEKQGHSVLENIGIPKNKRYICFHARDSSYLDTVLKTMDWSYHNYRDSNIQNYILTAEEMTNRGYYAIRMGAVVKERIYNSNPQIIDYATNSHRTDFSDIYIGSHCRFFLCSDGGISAIPEMLRIPVVYVNWTVILRISTWVLNGLFIFKKFYLKNQTRYMSFSEIINIEIGGWNTNEILDRLNLELIENTPEEILAVTIEMDERLNGTWESTNEDEILQKQFWTLFGPNKLRSPDLRIGAEFLRQNRELLN